MADNKNSSVIGQFIGKSCEADKMNNNEMTLSRELFENLIASEDYKRAMENRYYIGFMGHPSDPNCMDFRNACIVMTDMKLEDNNDVTATFDLIDTPVGRVVKSFIDAGVTFGISIRGAGDVDSNGDVDPETFVFRGFDLVTFPAYDDCVPVFQEIAASSDLDKQVKYKKVCSTLRKNLKAITSAEALEVIQEQFKTGSDEYAEVADRIDEITEESDKAARTEVLEEQVAALTQLYIDSVNDKSNLEIALADSQAACNAIEVRCSRKIASYKRIVAAQMSDLKQDAIDSKKQLQRVQATSAKEIRSLRQQVVVASERIKEANLKYSKEMKSNGDLLSQRDSTIDDLKSQLSETVTACKRLEKSSSDLDADRNDLLARVEAAERLVLDYQQAYADIYANALGVHLDNLPITASTSVQSLRDMISAGTSTSNMMSGVAVDDSLLEDDEIIDSVDPDENSDMITI